MSAQELFEDRIQPHLFNVRKALEEGKSTREVCEMLEISMSEWRFCLNYVAELVTLVEKIKGQNSKFYTHVLPQYNQIEKVILEGFTMGQVASSIGMGSQSFSRYIRSYPHFKDFIDGCKHERDQRVAGALYKRAIGYEYEEKKESIEEGDYLYDNKGKPVYELMENGDFKLKNGKKIHSRKKGKIKAEKTTKMLHGDVHAQEFWLVNRSDEWSRKDNEIEIDPAEIARQIQDSLTLMEDTVPVLPEESGRARIMDAISKMSVDETRAITETMLNIVRDLDNVPD